MRTHPESFEKDPAIQDPVQMHESDTTVELRAEVVKEAGIEGM